MIYGGTDTETIALNEITLWSGQYDENQEIECGKEKLAEIRRLFFDGKYDEGNEMGGKYLSGRPHSFGTHLPMGDLKIDLGHNFLNVSNYQRELDIQNSVTTVSYKFDNVNYQREYICSNPDDIIMIRFTADSKGKINMNLGLDLLRESDINVMENEITFTGQALFPKLGPGGVNYIGKIKVLTEGGELKTENDALSINNADEAVVVIDIRTDFNNPDYKDLCAQTVDKAVSRGYKEVRQSHIADYKKLFDRVELNLGSSEYDKLPTDARWSQLKKGTDDPGLFTLFFQYGRYLLISCSRENSPLPANLQGAWNDNLACNMPWTCDYHLDINTEQNYWLANAGNLHECNMPLFNYLEDLSVYGEKTAMKVYGSSGWTAHTVANVWGYTAPGQGYTWGMFPTAGVWLASHLWEHFTYTRDVDFLRNKAYPILKKSADFLLDYMVENPENGYLMTGPSISPENSFLKDGKEYALSMMPTCDRVLSYENFNACIEASRILNIDADYRVKLEDALK
jgi:alpha-L-fucosidase 2